jgi:hypothetical protein
VSEFAPTLETARDLVEKRGLHVPSKTGDDHHGVVRTLKGHRSTAAKQIGISLERLHRHRCQVDYDDSVVGLAAMSPSAVFSAQKIINDLKWL